MAPRLCLLLSNKSKTFLGDLHIYSAALPLIQGYASPLVYSNAGSGDMLDFYIDFSGTSSWISKILSILFILTNCFLFSHWSIVLESLGETVSVLWCENIFSGRSQIYVQTQFRTQRRLAIDQGSQILKIENRDI